MDSRSPRSRRGDHRSTGAATDLVVPDARQSRDLDEATIVARAQDGDLASFEELLERYQRVLFRICFRLLNDRGEAEDAVQEALITAWRRLPELSDPAAFRGWVYQIATRHCLAVIKVRSRRQTVPTSDDALAGAAAAADTITGSGQAPPDPAAQAERVARDRGLGEVLATLPAEQRACWVLKELHGLSYAEISEILTMPVSTVRGCLARARPRLLEGMSSWR